jgi:hypothetical protein
MPKIEFMVKELGLRTWVVALKNGDRISNINRTIAKTLINLITFQIFRG